MDSTTTQAPIPVTPEKQQEKVLFAYHENYTSDWYSELQDEEMTLYSYRGKEIKRAPKREYYIPDQEPPTYVWGQQIKNRPGGEEFTGLPMPDWMVMLKDKINMDFHVEVNHAIIIKYSDGVLHHTRFSSPVSISTFMSKSRYWSIVIAAILNLFSSVLTAQ